MKYLLIIITAGLLCGGCRTIYKDSTSLETSTAHKGQLQEAYERAIITEYVEIPVEKIIERPGQVIRDTVPVPKLIRQVVYEKGNRKQQTEDKAEIVTENKVIEKEGKPPWVWIAAGSAGTFLICIILLLAILLLRKKVA